MHRAFLIFHRWLALITGVVVVVVALTGAAISFEGSVRGAGYVHVKVGAVPLSLDTLVARARASAGGGAAGTIAFGDAPDVAYVIDIDSASASTAVTIDPYTGVILPTASGPTSLEVLARQLHQFHTSLLAGKTGRAVVAFVTLASLLLVISGLIIWWREKLWRINWNASWKRVVFDLHHALGLVAALVLLVICSTGVWMGYSDQITPLVRRLDRIQVPAGRPVVPPRDPGVAPVSFDSLVRTAQRAVPGAPIMFMQVPDGGPVMVGLRYPEDHTPAGRSRVYIDGYHGTVLQAANTRTVGAGTHLINLQRPLHTGEIFGVTTQVIWLLASLILATQAVTGVLMWWNGRAARLAAGKRGEANQGT